jgi:hypothetical protein
VASEQQIVPGLHSPRCRHSHPVRSEHSQRKRETGTDRNA